MQAGSNNDAITLAQSVYASCCMQRGVKVNAHIIDQLKAVAAPYVGAIDASQTFLGSQGIHALLDFVEVHQGVSHLNLSQNGIDADGIKHLCAVMSTHQSLVHVNLSHNRLSVPSARALWETARTGCKRIREILFVDCQILEEWEKRIQRCLDQNAAFDLEGFLPCAAPSKPEAWANTFVAVVGPASLVDIIVDHVIVVINSIVADIHVRVAPIVLLESDAPEQVQWKINACRDASNYNLPRCIAILDKDNFDLPWVQAVLQMFLSIGVPEVPPLKNKLGQQREAVPRLASHCFLYGFDAVAAREKSWDTTRFGSIEPSTSELQRNEEALAYVGLVASACPQCRTFVFNSAESLTLRAQCDVAVSFSDVYGSITDPFGPNGPSGAATSGAAVDAPPSPSVAGPVDTLVAKLEEMYQRLAPLGAAHSQDVNEVLRYVQTPCSTTCPLLLYGGEGVGKRHVAAAACMQLIATNPSRDDHVVAPFIWGHETTSSPVVMCYALLALFDHHSPHHTTDRGKQGSVGCCGASSANEHNNAPLKTYYPTVESLAEACRNAMANYSGAQKITVFMIGIDKIDNCGKRDFGVLSCFASCLPSTVRVVLTLATESPLLVGFRNRQPQPYERLIRGLPPGNLLAIVQSKLRPTDAVPGVSNVDGSGVTTTTSATKIILQKEDIESHVFCELLGLQLRYAAHRLDSDDAVGHFLTHEEVPGTVPALLSTLINNTYAAVHPPDALKAALLTLVVSPLPLMELVNVCERLAGVPKFSVIPLVMQLVEDGLLVMLNDAIVNIGHASIGLAVKEHYGPGPLQMFSTMVSSHMHRLVVTKSPEMHLCFRRCVPLLLENMQRDVVASIALDPVVVDQLLNLEQRARVFVIDAVYRLQHADQSLRELLAIHTLQFRHNGVVRRLRFALHQLQTQLVVLAGGGASPRASNSSSSNFFQVSLLAHRDSPYRTSAMDAIANATLPYPVLVPLNNVGQERCSILSEDLGSSGVHCHTYGDLLVTTTSSRVRVLQLSTLLPPPGSGICELVDPFGASVPLLGALIASETKVVVVASDQIIIWDLASSTWTLLPDVTMSLSGDSFDMTRTLCVGVVASSMELVMVDINKKRIGCRVSAEGAPDSLVVREVVFAGIRNMLIVVGVYEVVLMMVDCEGNHEMAPVVLQLNGVVRAVCASPDGKFVVTAVEQEIHVWTWRGELLHVCDGGHQHTASVSHVAFHPNGSLFASCGDDGVVKIWRTLTGLLVHDLRMELVEPRLGLPVLPHFVQFSTDGTRLFARCDDYIRQWDAITFLDAGAVRAASAYIQYLVVAPKHIAAVTTAGELKIWSTKTAFPTTSNACSKQISTLVTREGKITDAPPILCVKLSPGGDFFIARDAANVITTWNLATGSLLCRNEQVDSFCPLDSATLFTIEHSRIVVLSTTTSEVVSSVPLPRDNPVDAVGYDMCFSPDKSELFVMVQAGAASRIYVYDLPSFKLSNVFQGHASTIVYVAKIHSDLLISASLDGTVRLWSLSSHAERTAYRHYRPVVSAVDVVGAATLQRPVLFIDDAGDLFDVQLTDATYPERAAFHVQRKRIRRSGSDTTSAVTPSKGSAGLTSPANASTVSSVQPPYARKLKYASRLTKELLLLGDEDGALSIMHEQEAKILSTIPAANCSCAPQSCGTMVLVGTTAGEVAMYSVAVPPSTRKASIVAANISE